MNATVLTQNQQTSTNNLNSNYCNASEGKKFTAPILWVSDLIEAKKLSCLFNVLEFPEVLQNKFSPEDQHYIIAEPGTLEEAIRAVAWNNNPENCKVYSCNQSLHYWASTTEAIGQIIDYAVPFDEWARRKEEEPLSIGEACNIARIAFQTLPGLLKRQTELAKLMARVEKTSKSAAFSFGKVLRTLEAEFSKELLARGLVEDASLRAQLLALSDENDPFSRKMGLAALAKAYGFSDRKMSELFEQLLEELQLVEERDDNRGEIEKLLNIKQTHLNLNDFLPSTLANPLKEYCDWLKIRESAILVALLTATSSLHEVGTEVMLQRSQNFSVPPTIFGGIVSESGQKKSPITRQIITAPLNKLKSEEKAKYLEEKQEYEAKLAKWEKAKAAAKKDKQPFDEPEPKEPSPPDIYFFTDANGEGIKQQAQNAPHKALFGLVDELAGYFNSRNAYRGGKGADKQDMLSYYDGSGQSVLRSSGIKVDVPRIYLSLFGTIQPEILRDVMRDSSDPDGQWSRFLFAQQPLVASTLPDEEEGTVDITKLLTGIYRKLTLVPATRYRLSRSAFKLFQPWYAQLEQHRVSDPIPGMRAAYSKAEGYTGRLALNLHVLHELSLGVTPSPEIPVERMRDAIKLMKFFLGQTLHLYSQFDDGIAPHITKLIDMSRRKGWVKAKDVQLGYNSKNRPKPDVVREWMINAQQMGFGEVRGIGKKIEFLVFDENQKAGLLNKYQHQVDQEVEAGNIDINRVEEKVDRVEGIHTKPETKIQPALHNQFAGEDEELSSRLEDPVNQMEELIELWEDPVIEKERRKKEEERSIEVTRDCDPPVTTQSVEVGIKNSKATSAKGFQTHQNGNKVDETPKQIEVHSNKVDETVEQASEQVEEPIIEVSETVEQAEETVEKLSPSALTSNFDSNAAVDNDTPLTSQPKNDSVDNETATSQPQSKLSSNQAKTHLKVGDKVRYVGTNSLVKSLVEGEKLEISQQLNGSKFTCVDSFGLPVVHPETQIIIKFKARGLRKVE
ncbi:MAG: DUF3987 domain-containing protein [Cyanobacteriota bacterium]|nr:DUF3987 domain-containing protein [Cyanobacteriota bacterium]